MKSLTTILKQRRHGAALFGFVIITTASAAGYYYYDPTPDVIKIGVGQPLSSGIGPLGQDLVDGVTLAIEEINAGGGVRVGSKRVPLEAVVADDRSDAEAGKAAAKKLVDSGVVAAIAHLNSGVSIATAPIYAAAGVPQLAISTKPAYTQLNLPTTLRLVANDALQGQAMAEYSLNLPDAQKFAIIDDKAPYGKGLADGVAALVVARGKSVPVRHSLDDKTIDFSKLIPELKDGGVNILVTTMSDFQVLALIKQMAQAGLTQIRVVGGDTTKTDKLLEGSGMVAGIYATSPIVDAGEFPNGKVFLDKFRARFKKNPVYGAHYSYDAVYVIADALTRNRSVRKDKLLERLKEFDGNAPVTGSMRFRADGEQRYGNVGVYEVRDAAWALVTRSDKW
jgi:branched-chain amino acid transport system substrate-binding protein